jgi:hypothetical protein
MRKAAVRGIPGRELTTNARRITWIRIRRARTYVVIVGSGGVAIIAFLGLMPTVTRIPPFWRGLGAGVAVAVLVGSVGWSLLTTDGSMSWRVGALGELWTSDVLRRLGPEWTVLNNLRVPGADETTREIDHVAVGPGGVMVVETKLWPSKRRQLDTTSSSDVNTAAQSAQRQAGVVRWFLTGIAPDDVVRPTVMFWGSDLMSPDAVVVTNRNGVAIVHGRDSASWLQSARSHSPMDATTIAAALGKLEPCLVASQRLRDARPPIDWRRPRSP